MTNGSDERILVERVFDLGLPADTVWALLAQVERWPEWAPHIREARLDGEGTLGAESQGQFQFWPAGSGRVHMTTWEPPHLWTWRGRVVGLPDHLPPSLRSPSRPHDETPLGRRARRRTPRPSSQRLRTGLRPHHRPRLAAIRCLGSTGTDTTKRQPPRRAGCASERATPR